MDCRRGWRRRSSRLSEPLTENTIAVLSRQGHSLMTGDSVGERYSEYTPWGYSGAYYYVRIGYGWGG